MLEIIAACAMLAVLLGLTVEMLTVTAVERRAVERRATAILEAANIAERASLLGWDETTSEKMAALDLSAEVKKSLPDATLKLSVDPVEMSASEPAAKHVRIEITWSGPTGREAPVRLSYWVYAAGGGPRS